MKIGFFLVRITLLWEWVLLCLKRQGNFFFENMTSIKNRKKYKANLKIYIGKYASESFGSHFSHIGIIATLSPEERPVE